MTEPIRSLFFAPGNRPDLIAKFVRTPADCYVIDLEDGTPAGAKEQARAGLAQAVRELRAQNLGGLLTVRVNLPDGPLFEQDVRAALETDADGIVVPKLERASQLELPLELIRTRGTARRGCIVGGIESIRGVLDAVELAASCPEMAAVFFGAEDFVAEMGGVRTASNHEVQYARSRVVMAARAAGVDAVDIACVDIRNDDLYRRDAQVGREMGYGGKICVLPRQVAICHEVFTPGEAEVEQARRLLDAFDAAAAAGKGTFDFEGRFVDEAIVKRARAVVRLAR